MLRVWQLLLLNNGISSTFSLWWPCSSLKSLHDACHTSHTQLHQLPTICLARRNSCGNICDSRGDSPRQWGVDYVVTATETGTGSGTTPCCATTHISRSPRPINRHILLASCIHAWLLLAIKSARQQVAAALWFWCWFLAGIPLPGGGWWVAKPLKLQALQEPNSWLLEIFLQVLPQKLCVFSPRQRQH